MKKVAVVTGASRGAGKEIALALGQAGTTVYVTGRSLANDDSAYGGTIHETADLIEKSGGRGIAVAVDHADDAAVASLFDQVRKEHRKLDILVNNAANLIATTMPGGFWKKPLAAADLITVGLRSHFVASYYAAPLLIAGGKGLSSIPVTTELCATTTAPCTVRKRQARTKWLPTWPKSCARTMSLLFPFGWAGWTLKGPGPI